MVLAIGSKDIVLEDTVLTARWDALVVERANPLAVRRLLDIRFRKGGATMEGKHR
jgi:hypothetical protein